MNNGLRIWISVVAAIVTLVLLSFLLVVLKWEGTFLRVLCAAFAYGAGTSLNAFLKKKYPPKNQDQDDKEGE